MRRRDQLAAAAPALRRRQRRRAATRSASTSSHDLPGVGENLQDHLEVYVQYALQAAGLDAAVRSRSGAGRGSASSGCSCAAARARPTTSRAAASSASNDDVAYPNLMFHFLPIAIRYDGSAPAGGHGYQVHVGPMYSDARGLGEDHQRPTRACTRRCGSTTCPPSRTGASGSRRPRSPGSILNQPAFEPFNGGELSPGPPVETDEQILDWVARDGETALHPSCTCRMGTDDDVGGRPAHDARARRRRAARGRRLGRCPTSPTATSTRR